MLRRLFDLVPIETLIQVAFMRVIDGRDAGNAASYSSAAKQARFAGRKCAVAQRGQACLLCLVWMKRC